MSDDKKTVMESGADAKAVKDYIIDIGGIRTELPLNKKMFLALGGAVVLFFLLSFCVDLSAYGEKASMALGFMVAFIWFMTLSGANIALNAFILALFGTWLGFWEFGDVGTQLGKSSFFTMLGMNVVALGCEFTPFGQRMAYSFLKWFGQKPKRMIFVFAITAAVLSSLVSNTAVIIMMSSIAAALLSAMQEKPGESKIGKIMMLIVIMAAMVGGSGMICGSSNGNLIAIGYLEAYGYTVSFADWAASGMPTMLIVTALGVFVYIKWFKFRDEDCNALPKSYYAEKLESLGRIGGSEIRWLLIVAGMVICMLIGMDLKYTAILFAAINCFPGIGTVPIKKAFARSPWTAIFGAALLPMAASLINSTGLGDWVTDLLTPVASGLSPLMFSIVTSFIMGIMIIYLVNANVAVAAVCICAFTPVCIGLGYNPSVVMMPSLFLSSFFFAHGQNYLVVLNKDYGYWDGQEPLIPGTITQLIACIILPLVCFAICSLIGMPIYI